jgi:hypothetical protein
MPEHLRHDPALAPVPPYLPDCPELRAQLVAYYDAVTYIDEEIRKRLAWLDTHGLRDNTLVIFLSDHGRGLPREKRWCYDAGIHLPLIVRWPGKIQPGSTEDALVAWVDIAPTILAAAGVPVPSHMQGQIFLGADRAEPREFVYAGRDRMDAVYDKVVILDAAQLPPIVSWGSSPEDVISVQGVVPNPDDIKDENKRASKIRALEYMGLTPGTKITDISVERVFIGSCTNGRIEDLRAAAKIVGGKKVASHVNAMVVPGSGLVKEQAEAEGLDVIFKDAGFEWREPGCSMCLAMNPDKLKPHERCASTSNRNFEGRQGFKGRTHLVSPQMAAAAAIAGHFVDIREWQ